MTSVDISPVVSGLLQAHPVKLSLHLLYISFLTFAYLNKFFGGLGGTDEMAQRVKKPAAKPELSLRDPHSGR